MIHARRKCQKCLNIRRAVFVFVSNQSIAIGPLSGGEYGGVTQHVINIMKHVPRRFRPFGVPTFSTYSPMFQRIQAFGEEISRVPLLRSARLCGDPDSNSQDWNRPSS